MLPTLSARRPGPMLTGRYSTRFGFEFTPVFKIGPIIFNWMQQDSDGEGLPVMIDVEGADQLPEMEELGMPSEQITIAEVLKARGYHNVHIGKWHLGSTGDMRPEHQGFDESLYMAGMLYLPEDHPDVVNAKRLDQNIEKMVWASSQYKAQFNGGEAFEPDGYLTDYYSREAVKVIENNKNRPFFMFLSHWGIHNPLQATREDYDALAHIEDHHLRVYAAMIRAVDRSIGMVTQALEDNGLTENTLILFTSDNGGAQYIGLPDVNKPFRAEAQSLGGYPCALHCQVAGKNSRGKCVARSGTSCRSVSHHRCGSPGDGADGSGDGWCRPDAFRDGRGAGRTSRDVVLAARTSSIGPPQRLEVDSCRESH